MVRYTIPTKVVKVERVNRLVRAELPLGGTKDDVITTHEDMGWYILLEGSREMLYLGREEPLLKKGDPVRIIIERVEL